VAVTLLAGLSVRFGVHRLVAAMLLNIWFLIALSLPVNYARGGTKIGAWSQSLAWLIGAALWIAFTCVLWMARGRALQPGPVPEIPGDTKPMALTRPVILFAVIRAFAVGVAVAIAFGSHKPNADWMPIAALAAMKPSLEQSAQIAEQRVIGTAMGAVLAIGFLFGVDNKHVLEVVILALAVLAGSIRTVNYAVYTAAVAALVLIATDIPHPSDLATEGQRVLFTFIGVGIALVVMALASVLQKRAAAKPAAA
jgi:uncharacterized membrane protein YccC